jgi:hypothetical protein
VAEAFGVAYAEMKDLAKAIEWYRVAVNAADASASFRASEQLGDQLVRHGETLRDAAAARAMVGEGIALLEKVAALQPTVERESLLGAAYKRLAMIEGRDTSEAARRACLKALEAMAQHYGEAEALARNLGAGNLYYPAKNAISAELRIAWIERRPARGIQERLEAVRDSLAKAAAAQPDFWSVVGQSELRALEALARGQLADANPALIKAFRELKARVPAPRMWDSVYTEARFMLEPYRAAAGAAEAKAAKELLACLDELARTT